MPSVAESHYRALAEFRYYIRRFLHFSEQSARAAGLEPQQHQLLLAVRGLGAEAHIANLADRLQIQHHSTVELVDRLALRRLVSRTRAAGDRRQVVVHLTARGRAKLEKLASSHLDELRKNGPALVKSLQSLLRRAHVR